MLVCAAGKRLGLLDLQHDNSLTTHTGVIILFKGLIKRELYCTLSIEL